MEKNTKLIIGIVIIAILIGIGGLVAIALTTEKPENVFNEYKEALINKEYEKVYSLLSEESKANYEKEKFINRLDNIFDGIDASDIEINLKEKKKEGKYIVVSYSETMKTSAGDIDFENTAKLLKNNKTYKLIWNDTLIFPDLKDNYSVSVKSTEAQRGKILDKNGIMLAGSGGTSAVGLVPGKMNEESSADLERIAQLLEISVQDITKQLNASYVKEDTFVQLKTIEKDNEELKEKLLKIKGVKISTSKDRSYPYKNSTSHIVGYVQNISKEELDNNKGKGYTDKSIIGKAGIEKAYEEKLKGTNGKKVIIRDENKNELKVLAQIDKKDGEDIYLTIDAGLQQKLYEQLKNDKGLITVMNPKTGELLALVSTPSYNSNDFVSGMSTEKWNSLSNDANKPLYNRFEQKWCPGSTFKPVTGAIALTTGKLTADEKYEYVGKSWQKDSSWGDYKITTLTDYGTNVNLENALVFSDNIFFARVALKMGKDTFAESLKKLGFTENVPFYKEISKSQFSNSENFTTEIKLADSGYGQGDILVNPIHMASIYSAFANKGNMIKPVLVYEEENQKAEWWKEGVFTEEAAKTIKNDLVQVVERGTAKNFKIQGMTIAGKTGTAELKKSKEDEGEVLGWFNAITADESSSKQYVVVSMIEDANSKPGASHYLFPIVQSVFKY